MSALQRFVERGDGVTAIEYALIGAFVALAIVASVTAVGTTLSNIFDQVAAGF